MTEEQEMTEAAFDALAEKLGVKGLTPDQIEAKIEEELRLAKQERQHATELRRYAELRQDEAEFVANLDSSVPGLSQAEFVAVTEGIPFTEGETTDQYQARFEEGVRLLKKKRENAADERLSEAAHLHAE